MIECQTEKARFILTDEADGPLYLANAERRISLILLEVQNVLRRDILTISMDRQTLSAKIHLKGDEIAP